MLMAARRLLWLGSFPDGSLRPKRRHDDETKIFVRAFLQPTDWLRAALCRHGGEGFDKQTLYALGGDAVLKPADQRVVSKSMPCLRFQLQIAHMSMAS